MKESIFEGLPQTIITLISLVDPQYRNVLIEDTNDFILICVSCLFSFFMIVITISQIDSESFETFEKDEEGNIKKDRFGNPSESRGNKDYRGLKKGTFFRFCFRFFEMNIFLSLWVFLFYISWELCFSWVVFQISIYTFLYFNNSKPTLIQYDGDIKPDIQQEPKHDHLIKRFDGESKIFYNNRRHSNFLYLNP